MGPVLCLITDRRRCGGDWRRDLVARVGAAARAGVHLVQVRERDLDGGLLVQLVDACVQAIHGTCTRVVVNDRVDVALAAGAHGVHLRSDSVPAARARAVAPPGFLLGRSVHSVDEALSAAAEGSLDYLIFGTVFPTSSKPGRDAAGLETLAAAAAATPLPLLAVGGVTAARAARVAAAGAAGIAAIGMFADPPVSEIASIVDRLNAGVDTFRRLP